MKLLTHDMTLTVNDAEDGYLSTVGDVAMIDVSDIRNISVFLNQVDDFAILDLATKTTNIDTILVAKVAGATPSVVFAGGAGAKAGTIGEVGSVVTITLKDGVSTVADAEALLATSTLVGILHTGTAANLFATADDAFVSTPLALGAATFTVTIEKSQDGVNFSAVSSITEADMPSGLNVAAEKTLSAANGVSLLAKEVRLTLTALDGSSRFSAVASGALQQ